MNTTLIDGGFLEELNHPIIQRIEFNYHDPTVVFFQNGTKKAIHISCNSYHSQYGIAVSEDGDLLFQGNWYAKEGLIAYHIMDDRIFWKKKLSHIGDIEVHNGVLTVVIREKSIVQFNMYDSSIIRQLQSKSIERMYRLNRNLVLINRFKGKICILNLESFSIEASFPENVINPNQCLSILIHSVYVEDGSVLISGFEGGGTISEPKPSVRLQPFRRVIGEIT